MADFASLRVGRDARALVLSAPADGHPVVHFYEDEAFPFDLVSTFLGAGLDAGDRLIVIATPEHRSAFVQSLQARNVKGAIADGRLLLLDARETLAGFMVNGWPDASRFHSLLEDALKRAARGSTGLRIRAYAEMADLLWRDGERSAAIALEQLWNEACSRHAFAFVRAHVMANFYKAEADPGAIGTSGHPRDALPAESVADVDVGSTVAETGRLRARLRVVELELGKLREVEHALRRYSWVQRRLAMGAILASEARFHHLVDAVTDYAIFMLDAAGCVLTWNAGAERTKGYIQDEIIGRHFSVFYTPEDRTAGKPAHVLETVRHEGRFEEEGWRVRKDGTRFWANVVITALHGDNGQISGFAKVTRDLTSKREAAQREQELAREQMARAASEKASRDLARLNRIGALFIAEPSRLEPILLEILDTAIDIAGADFGNIQLVEPDALDLRIVAQRGLPQWWLDLWNRISVGQGACGTALERGEQVVVEDVERSPIFVGTPALDTLLRAGIRAVVSTPIVSRSGQALGMFSTHYRVSRHPDDGVLQMFDVLAGQAADILDRARAEEASALIRTQLEQANRAKDEFVATMSHELRTPLNAMLGWATLLRRGHPDPLKLERGLEVIERNVATQTRLVSDLLDVSRIISGKLRMVIKRMEVSAAIYAAADVVRPAAEAKRVRLVLDLDPEMGTTIADPDRLQQIIWNLLSNAVRFTPAGGRVVVTAHRDGSRTTIRVQDTGCGIAAEHLPHIFERFRQVESSTTRRHQGLGLGLAIVRHLVEAHGGTVVAASEGVGLGTSFTIDLPIPAVNVPGAVDDAHSAEPEVEMAAAPAATPAELRNVRALVIDDDADSLELVRLVLEGSGAVVTTATGAADGLAARGPFDIIVSDIGMPEMDGYALISRVRSREGGATVPAIALTAFARPEDADRAVQSGYQEHLTKPVQASALIEAVHRWTRSTG